MSRKRARSELETDADSDHADEFAQPDNVPVVPNSALTPAVADEDMEIVKETFKQVWSELDLWKDDWTVAQLDSLRDGPSLAGVIRAAPTRPVSPLSDDTDYEDDGETDVPSRTLEPELSLTISGVEVPSVIFHVEFQDNDADDPVFESYAELYRNVFRGEDSDHMPFIPFADEIDEYVLDEYDEPAEPQSTCTSHHIEY